MNKQEFMNDASFVKALEKGGVSANDELRGIAMTQGMVLTPILSSPADVKTQTIPAQNGQPARTFAYIDTKEEVRLSVTALTRRGNGIPKSSNKVMEAFAEIAERISTHPNYQLRVNNLYSRPGNNGNMQHQAVFSELNAE